jgi:hypothetical protein
VLCDSPFADNPEAAWNWRIGGASAFDDEEEVAVSGKAADDDSFLSGLAVGLELHNELSPEQKDLMRVVLEQVGLVAGLPGCRGWLAYMRCGRVLHEDNIALWSAFVIHGLLGRCVYMPAFCISRA